MSELYWSEDAEKDLDDITAYIARSNAAAAVRMRGEIEQRIEVLANHPEAGRSGRVTGTREMALAGTPYIAVYLIKGDDVTVLRVLHGAQRWPPLVG